MKSIICMLKAKLYCKKIKHRCQECKYAYDQHDWWGCTYNF